MTTQQWIIFGILTVTMALFIWNRWRYDVVSLAALLVATITGIVPADEVFSGFSHPAVITVVAVLVVSKALFNAGVIDLIARQLGRVGDRPMVQVAALTGLVTVCSGFMNNVGALALLMPVATWMSRKSGRSPSLLLMPMAFGSLLGGMLTLIGTPPNMIISAYRANVAETPFGMFDFMPVGVCVALVGVVFISLVGWRLIPKQTNNVASGELFEISEYISELRVPEESKFAGFPLHDLLLAMPNKEDITIVGLVRNDKRFLAPSMYRVLRAGDILMVETDSDSLKSLIDDGGLEFIKGDEGEEGGKEKEDEKGKPNKSIESDEVSVLEAIVASESLLIGKTASRLLLRERYGVNVIAVARRGKRIQERLGCIRFMAADILLLQGGAKSMPSTLSELGCLPLAERGLRIGKPRKVLLPVGIFAVAMTLVAVNVLPAQIALTCAALVLIVAGLLSPTDAYKSIDWPVVVLLGAMIPIGNAFETTGAANLIADQLHGVAQATPPAATLAILMVGTMLLSNIVNNAAAAILMAPIAASLSHAIGANADPFLMCVAVGASCAFLTPIGHQSNAMVMAPGGYRFGDYWRMGLPLSVLVVVVGVPTILWFWPL
ncbi:MAG TPA: SLC13 family permease [Verrucomicrobia bacterium]|jgi:di/tricarboxylate transporter|nr:SLC13 family permease [Verrucomicrobiota bacterium]